MRESGRLADAVEALKRRHGGSSKSAEPGSGGHQDEPSQPTVRPAEPEPPDFSTGELNPAKITGYAMNPDHPVGRNKYRVIHSATGLDVADAATIEDQIREGVRNGNPVPGKVDQYGQRWAVDVPLAGPSGTIMVRTAWIVDAGSTIPRLVTISFPK
jgi:hypothetical protein